MGVRQPGELTAFVPSENVSQSDLFNDNTLAHAPAQEWKSARAVLPEMASEGAQVRITGYFNQTHGDIGIDSIRIRSRQTCRPQ